MCYIIIIAPCRGQKRASSIQNIPRVASLGEDDLISGQSGDLIYCQRMGIMSAFDSFDDFTTLVLRHNLYNPVFMYKSAMMFLNLLFKC